MHAQYAATAYLKPLNGIECAAFDAEPLPGHDVKSGMPKTFHVFIPYLLPPPNSKHKPSSLRYLSDQAQATLGMAPFNPVIASLNFTQAPNFSHGLQQFIVDRNLFLAFMQKIWKDLIDWISQPRKPRVLS